MCADVGDSKKIGATRYNAKAKQENRRRMGRKIVVSGLRTLNENEEIYAIVTKMLGNGTCEVECTDGARRLCIIRKKFRGRGKSHNRVCQGATVMVGLRDWEKNEKSALPKCDLLEVYSESELRKLKQMGGIDTSNISYRGIVTEHDDVEFDTSADYAGQEGNPEEITAQPDRYREISDDSDDTDSDVDVDDL